MEYNKRIFDDILAEYLQAFGAVLIEGPKWCGKTTTATQYAKSVIKMQDVDYRNAYLATANSKPSLLLRGENPRLIDEWQDAPILWDAVRTSVDDRNETGLYILTGSNSVDDSKIHHTGTGRIARLKMYPMSLYESKESSGEVSLSKLFNELDYDIDGAMSPMFIENLIFAACRGGWPGMFSRNTDNQKLMLAKAYLDGVCNRDINKIDGFQKDERTTRVILRAYARNISTLAKKSTLLKDIQGQVESLSEPTFDKYLKALERIYVIEDIKAWSPSIRSSAVMRKTPKREFIDPSIAVAALGLTPDMLMVDLHTFGFIFETMCVRDLKVYSQAIGSNIEYYHDRYGLEADFVLHLHDGRYALIECKLGSQEIEKAAQHLLELKRLIKENANVSNQSSLREPDLLIILTGGQMAYTRPDGVKVIPLGCLKD